MEKIYDLNAELAWQAFLWTIAPLVFKYIGLKTLHHLDPSDPSPALSSTHVFPTVFSSACQHRARPPLLTSDLHLFPLPGFIYWGTSHLAHIS